MYLLINKVDGDVYITLNKTDKDLERNMKGVCRYEISKETFNIECCLSMYRDGTYLIVPLGNNSLTLEEKLAIAF